METASEVLRLAVRPCVAPPPPAALPRPCAAHRPPAAPPRPCVAPPPPAAPPQPCPAHGPPAAPPRHVASHVPVHAPSAAKPRGSSGRGRRFTAETDSLLEQAGFEPSVPVRRLGAKLARKQLRHGPVGRVDRCVRVSCGSGIGIGVRRVAGRKSRAGAAQRTRPVQFRRDRRRGHRRYGSRTG